MECMTRAKCVTIGVKPVTKIVNSLCVKAVDTPANVAERSGCDGASLCVPAALVPSNTSGDRYNTGFVPELQRPRPHTVTNAFPDLLDVNVSEHAVEAAANVSFDPVKLKLLNAASAGGNNPSIHPRVAASADADGDANCARPLPSRTTSRDDVAADVAECGDVRFACVST
jgi:hypothetical protein